MLRDPQERVREAAEYSLEGLTRRSPLPNDDDLPDADFAALQEKWRTWWNLHAQTAAIYSEDSCGPTLPLN